MAETESLPLRKRCLNRFEGLKAARKPYEAEAKEIATYTMPRRSRWLFGEQNKNRKQAVKRRNSNHGVFTLRTTQGGMTSGLSSGSRPWFTLGAHDDALADNAEVKIYCGEVERRMYSFIAATNLYTAFKTGYQELAGFGTEACVLLEHPLEGMVAHQLTFGEYYIAENNAKQPGALYRHCTMTALVALQTLGRDFVSSRVKAAYDRGNYEDTFEFIHAIEENDEMEEGRAGWRGKPWLSLYWEVGQEHKAYQGDTELAIKGYDEQPFWAPRWDTTGGDAWGTGPGHDALDDLRELQMQAKRKGEATDLHVWPEKIVSSKVKLKNQPKSIVHSSEVDVTKSVYIPHQIEYQTIGVIREDIEKCERAVEQAFYADLFMAITNMQGIQPRNIEEIAARNEEKLTQLGPVIERVNNEKLEVAIERIYGIMLRGGLLPDPPEVLQGRRLKIEFISILTQMQRMVGLGQIERGVQFVGGLAGLYPEARHKIDAMEAIDEYWLRAGAPAKVLRSTEDAEKDAQAEASAAQNQQLAENAGNITGPVKELTEAAALAAETPTSGVPPVEALLPLVPR